jgi:hypothetical protein
VLRYTQVQVLDLGGESRSEVLIFNVSLLVRSLCSRAAGFTLLWVHVSAAPQALEVGPADPRAVSFSRSMQTRSEHALKIP